MARLAINGGKKVRTRMFPSQCTFREDKTRLLPAIEKILGTNVLSAYRGNAGTNFWGGDVVQEFERALTNYVGAPAIATNSCTSALWIACGAIGLKPGDEVIVSPWSMSCSATVPMLYGAIPVFADLNGATFNLDPDSVRSKITSKTKAIIVVDLFGRIADEINGLRTIATEFNLKIIEDAAQAFGAYRISDNKKAGTFGDIGCFSFTQGKHLTSGEGGAIVSNNDELLERCAMLRNHAEAVDNDFKGAKQIRLSDMVGMNLRMTEIQAAIMLDQLSQINNIVTMRRDNAFDIVSNIGGRVPSMSFQAGNPPNASFHSMYVAPFFYVSDGVVSRDKYIEAVKAELTEEADRIDRGVPIGCGYIKPLYRFPVFQNKKHWSIKNATIDYTTVNLPIVEDLYNNKFFLTLYHGLHLTDADKTDISDAFVKVWTYRSELE